MWFIVALMAIFAGYIIALVTSLYLGKERARRLPLGSMLSGGFILIAASELKLVVGNTPFFAISGAVCGLAGWMIYRLITPVNKIP